MRENKGIFNRLRGDKVCVEIKRARGVSVKQLTYICRRQKVNLNKIDRAIGNQRTRLLCCEEMTFPNDSGYKRFYSPLFQQDFVQIWRFMPSANLTLPKG